MQTNLTCVNVATQTELTLVEQESSGAEADDTIIYPLTAVPVITSDGAIAGSCDVYSSVSPLNSAEISVPLADDELLSQLIQLQTRVNSLEVEVEENLATMQKSSLENQELKAQVISLEKLLESKKTKKVEARTTVTSRVASGKSSKTSKSKTTVESASTSTPKCLEKRTTKTTDKWAHVKSKVDSRRDPNKGKDKTT